MCSCLCSACCPARFANAIRGLVLIVSIAGLAFSFLSLSSCHFVQVQSVDQLETTTDFDGSLGIWMVGNKLDGEDSKEFCGVVQADFFEKGSDVMTIARMGSVLAPAFGGIAVLVQLTELLVFYNCCFDHLISPSHLLASAAQASTFVIIEIDMCRQAGCELSTGCMYGIVAIACFMGSCFFLMCAPRARPMLCRRSNKTRFDDGMEG